MTTRLFKPEDLKEIQNLVTRANISYITHQKIYDDIANQRLLVLVDEHGVIGFCALQPEPDYGYIAIKRLFVEPMSRGKGGSNELLSGAISTAVSMGHISIGATPAENNKGCRAILSRWGFRYCHTFEYNGENLCFYLRSF